jgi:hypothetical protein
MRKTSLRPGRKASFTKEDVAKAIESTRALPGGPTLRRVREALGGGSFSTISPLFRELMLAEADGQPSGEARIAGLEARLKAATRELERERQRRQDEVAAAKAESRLRADDFRKAQKAANGLLERLAVAENKLKEDAKVITELKNVIDELKGNDDWYRRKILTMREAKAVHDALMAALGKELEKAQAQLAAYAKPLVRPEDHGQAPISSAMAR